MIEQLLLSLTSSGWEVSLNSWDVGPLTTAWSVSIRHADGGGTFEYVDADLTAALRRAEAGEPPHNSIDLLPLE